MLTEDDNFPLKENLDLIIPIGITHIFGEEPIITYYPEAENIAKWLCGLEDEKLFSDEILFELEEKIASEPCFGRYGLDDGLRLKWSHIFRIGSREQLNKDLIQNTTEILMPDCEYKNITECNSYEYDLLCFGTVIDGRIVSAASENPGCDPDGSKVTDIGVETYPDFCGKGYGSSNVAALSYYLLDPGKSVSYIVQRGNTASVRIAKKVGFEDIGREYQCVMYRKI